MPWFEPSASLGSIVLGMIPGATGPANALSGFKVFWVPAGRTNGGAAVTPEARRAVLVCSSRDEAEADGARGVRLVAVTPSRCPASGELAETACEGARGGACAVG